MKKLDNYYLDVNRVRELKDDKIISFIIGIYQDITHGHYCETYFNTLIKSGVLKNKVNEDRSKKTEEIING